MRLFKPNIPKMVAKKDLRGLVEALGDEDPKIVWDAASALGDLKDPRAGDLLLEALGKPASRLGAIRALGFTSNLRALEPLIAALQDNDANVRRSAAFALPMLPDPRVVEPLAAALEDADHDVRWEAGSGLAMLKDPRGIDYLIGLLHQHGMVGYEAAQAAKVLGKCGGARAVEALLAAIHDKDTLVRTAASEALGELKDPGSIEPLRAAIKDPR
ncbi:MAG: HEAT repeat domain-containing protein, partial [Anaerolineales bacterium]|nr:HEAT repeat domain-containing protein [Anaerolineales bacterium]